METEILYSPPASYQSSEIDFVQTELTGSVAVPETAFAPASEGTIVEIMGFVTLGLPQLSMEPRNIPATLFKWHVWLTRMNNWLQKEKSRLLQLSKLPSVNISADLYFMSKFSPSDIQKQLTAVQNAPLGPLLPGDINTMIHALQKGLSTCSKFYGNMPSQTRQLVQFLSELNRIAVHAIQPQDNSLQSHMTLRPDELNGGDLILTPSQAADTGLVVPIPQLGLKTDGMSTEIPHSVELPDGYMFEEFRPAAYNDVSNHSKFKKGGGKLKILPNMPPWVYAIVILMIMYYFTKDTQNVMTGGCGDASCPFMT